MRRDSARRDVAQRLCEWLARPGALTDLLDAAATIVVPRQLQVSPVLHRPGSLRRWQETVTAPLLMATGPGTTGPTQVAPPQHSTHGPDAGDRPGWWSWLWNSSSAHRRRKQAFDASVSASGAACAQALYRGMHGRPCKFAGGSDTKCPAGTVSGWFWRYQTPVGIVYYVDCCGGRSTGNVWCNWSNEPNWCLGAGRAVAAGVTDYNCTLAIPDSAMTTTTTAGGGYEVVGVDP